MKISKLVDTINRGYIASDYLRAPMIYYYMDQVIDDINDELNTNYPTFTEWGEFVETWNGIIDGSIPAPSAIKPNHYNQHFPEMPSFPVGDPNAIKDRTVYDAIPDRYLRKVVALGTALKYYINDEEGEQIALDYQRRYIEALFKMTRDLHEDAPWYFRDEFGGFIDFKFNREQGPIDRNPKGVELNGEYTRDI